MNTQSPAIETTHLRKVYGSRLGKDPFTAVQDLSLTVPRGQVFGFLGPNGAGKTTTINMLLGNITPTSGEAKLLGQPLGDRDARARLGFLPEKFQFHEFLTAEEFLDFHGKLYGMSRAARKQRIPETLEQVGLIARRNSKVGEFSKGMQQRVGLAQAILNDPDLVILDEPTSALDPLGRREVREIVTQLKAQGKTVLLNSHLLSEIEMTCDRVAIIKAGQVIRQGTMDDLLAAPSTVEIRVQSQTPALIHALESLSHSVTVNGELVTAAISDEAIVPDLAAAVVGAGGRLLSLVPRRESLEDLFIRVVEDAGLVITAYFSGVFTLAGLTIREALRRRIFLAALVISALYVGFAFLPLHIRPGFIVGLDMASARNNSGRLFVWLGCGTIKFFGSVLAVALSAGAITSEIDRGVLSVIVPKPIPRSAIYIGKWLGIVTLLLVCVLGWGGLLGWSVWKQTGTYHARLWGGVLAAGLFPLLFTTLTLFFSTFAAQALSSSLALIAAGVALAESLLHRLGEPLALNSPTLETLSQICGYVVPLGRMNHWITRGLDATGFGAAPPGSAGLDFSLLAEQRDPTSLASVAVAAPDMTYILVYIAVCFALGLFLFQRRDL